MDTDDLAFGPWFDGLLRSRRLTRLEASRRIGVSSSLVSRWCNERGRPNTTSCYQIAQAFGIPVRTVMIHAGHVDPDMPQDDPVKDRMHQLIDELPSSVLEPFISVFENLTDR